MRCHSGRRCVRSTLIFFEYKIANRSARTDPHKLICSLRRRRKFFFIEEHHAHRRTRKVRKLFRHSQDKKVRRQKLLTGAENKIGMNIFVSSISSVENLPASDSNFIRRSRPPADELNFILFYYFLLLKLHLSLFARVDFSRALTGIYF